MEAVIQTSGFFSLPSKLKTRDFRLAQGLKNRFSSKNIRATGGSSPSLHKYRKARESNAFACEIHGSGKEGRDLQICRAEAAAAADGHTFLDDLEKPKLFGIEILTLKKIIPLGLMFFCILFNCTILRDTKDVLVVTAKGSSAEIIPFLKTWVNLPMAVGFMLLYRKLSNVLSKEALFYTIIFPFIAFFAAFAFILYPLSSVIHPIALADRLLDALGPSFLGPVAILRIWTFCLFYVMAELWGSVVISVLFWGFANQEKPKLGMMESMKFLLSSRYVRDLATLVVAYGISINLVEVTWKSKLKAQFPSPNEYSSFMGDFSTATGIATFTMMLLSRLILRKYGWGVAAMITPTVLLLTGVGFFSLVLFGEPLTPMLGALGMTPLLAAVYVGALQNIFSNSAKYSLFDPCKEMAYIPLDEDTKVKGKAAIDVVCNPLGKSGGALI